MPDGYIQLPPDDPGGKRLHTFLRPDGSHVEAVRDAPTGPRSSVLFAEALAAGASVVLDADVIAPATVAKLAGVTVASGAPLKAELQSVVAATPTTRDVVFTSDAALTAAWRPPHPDFVTVPAGGHFRVRLTNQDNVDAADVYATLYWDEDDA